MPNQQQFMVVASLAAQTGGSLDGAAVDLQNTIHAGGRNIKAFACVTNTGGDPGETLVIKVQEAPDNDGVPGAWSDVAGAAFAAFDDAADGAEAELHFVTNERFVRLVSTGSGTTPVFTQYGAFLLEKRLS